MIRLQLGAALAVVVVVVAPGERALGDADVSAGQGTFNAAVTDQSGVGAASGSSAVSGNSESRNHTDSKPACQIGGARTCLDGQGTCPDGTPMEFVWDVSADGVRSNFRDNCVVDAAAPVAPTGPTPADIARAFEQVRLPESVLVIQPPGGATLVNFETNFYTEAAPFERTVTLLGHRVRFKISARSFTWHFGDPNGHSDRTTTSPGAAYPHLEVTHRYLHKGTVAPSVDTTWAADYQLDGRPWTPVNGTVTRRGAAQRLAIRSATPLLVG